MKLKINPRKPYEDDKPDGYLEGDRDYMENNVEACVWFLDNSEDILKAVDLAERLYQTLQNMPLGPEMRDIYESAKSITNKELTNS